MAELSELATELTELKAKVQELQDKEEIRDVLTRYAFNADLNRTENYLRLYTEDGSFVTDGLGGMVVAKGKDNIKKEILHSATHQSITNNSQHLQLDYLVTVDGDAASATGYHLITVKWVGGFGIFRCAFRTFRFQRVDRRWLINEVISVALGKPECQNLVSTDW